jgi:hypothetical protein
MSSSPIAVLLPHRPVTSIAPAAVTEHEQPGLLAVLAAVPDPRDPRGVRYPLASVLAVAVCAVLAGAVTFAAIADWVRDLDSPAWARLGFTDRIPVASTVWRLLVRVNAEVLSTVLAGWLRARVPATIAPPVADRRWRRVIAIDGKVLRGSRLPDGSQVHLLPAYDTSTGVVLAQVQIAAKSNEIPAFTPLLDRVQAQLGSLNGTIIVADALHAQTGHAREVAARGAHLMVTVKANQPTLHNLLKALPWAEVPVGAGRRPAPRQRPRPAGNPHRQSVDRPHSRRARLPPRRTGHPDHPHPHRQARWQRQDQPRNGLPGDIATGRARSTRPTPGLGPAGVAHREPAALDPRCHPARRRPQARTGNGPAVAAVLRNTAIGYHRSNGETNIARATRRANRRPNDLIDAVTRSNPTTQ